MENRCQSGQMAVELAVVLPVVLIVMVIAIDLLAFSAECARFDHLAAQAVLSQGASAGTGEYDLDTRADRIAQELNGSFASDTSSVSVKPSGSSGMPLWHTCTFTCTLEMAPWPFRTRGLSAFGVNVPTSLVHEYRLAVEAYTPGKLL